MLEYRNIHLTKYALTIFFEDILALSRLSITEETIKIEFSFKKNHHSTTNYHFLHFLHINEVEPYDEVIRTSDGSEDFLVNFMCDDPNSGLWHCEFTL